MLELVVRARLDTPDKLLHCLERASMAQEQVDERGKPPVIIYRPPGPSLAHLAATRSPSLIIPDGSRSYVHVLQWPSALQEARGDPHNAIEGAFDLGARIRRCAHGTRLRHNTVLPLWLGWDGHRPPRTKPRGSRGVVNR